ncbi:hypothetical protein [Marivirga harenae]|uniref:hypothetical protein n=1 Tax=Marivirga harenae TaxID=2010992 RepID=UPI0026E01FEA|nr:hypothetical protein [Marivirga harenae]WKV13780.1 hypothetical protein Q3Y49_08060 [Marivirga harenae]|tara:strand:+ start:80185 stop:81240 length:1056 start_codon:yes stop_codon:yes gene_type:complete
MALISKKKKIFPVSDHLMKYLKNHGRQLDIPIKYDDLTRANNAIPLYDSEDKDTLWETLFFPQDDMKHIYYGLKNIYAILKADGDLSVMEHLYVDRVDACTYGNTYPFRVRIVNKINDNFDYFYIKKADASRIYGLELEHLLSPNRMSYIVNGATLIEEHIPGIPGDQFIKNYMDDAKLNKIRLAKEFVKFTERCFVRLLGDMHSSNFVIDITPDFEEIHYRIKSIDFDQQSYEGRKAVYMPQYFKQNNPIIELGLELMTPATVKQYQKEERSLIVNRMKASDHNLKELMRAMKKDKLTTPENLKNLKAELAEHYKHQEFNNCKSMGEVVAVSLTYLKEHNNLTNQNNFLS